MTQRRGGKRHQVFVAHAYGKNLKAYRRVFRALEAQYPVAFVFADEKTTNLHLLQKVESYIKGSAFSIFDITGWNPNVTLELGIAYALDENWYIAVNTGGRRAKEVPSDIRGIDRIQYRSYPDLEGKLAIILEDRFPRHGGPSLEMSIDLLKRKTLKILYAHPGMLMAEIAPLLGVELPAAQATMNELINSNRVRLKGQGRGTRYYAK